MLYNAVNTFLTIISNIYPSMSPTLTTIEL